jgi:dihydrofolate synthase / folylpolyglutamate synthase
MKKILSLNNFLARKPLYYDFIDNNRIKYAYNIVKTHIKKLPYIIHIVGTNGKGTTGRFLAHYLYKIDFKVLHYSSPHILRFNERIWINGSNIDDNSLEITHQKLQNILSYDMLDNLTYFEYTTLLALILSSSLDYLILEAGLGGEFDATNVVKNDLSLITPIDFDHQDFLGNTIEQIATTKLRSCDTKMIVNTQKYDEVYKIASNFNYTKVKQFNTSFLNHLPSYLLQNLQLSLSALEYLNIDINMKLFQDIEFFGRCQKIRDNIIIDVGHNPLAARVLKEYFISQNKKTYLVYNSFSNKDYKQVLNILKPIINEIYIINIKDDRIVSYDILISVCKQLNIKVSNFNKIDNNKEYLVFGSFSVVENFLNSI